ncbi:CoA transferase [Bordetella sp. BOR01]|uniref:CoA transferase n=1 Tax=Bordetella sp. BOR01 TaxID=2854779 RepID=UPI001C4403C9|nr:CoA transferase [Bordetella sp. BOR01]MBV7482287.1 CoA transferase [Bordetella sp. BOR01]
MNTPEPGKAAAFAELMQVRGLGAIDPAEVTITGHDPFFATPYRVGEAVAASIAAVGVAANDIWQLRAGRRQALSVDVRAAAATLRTVDYTRARQGDGSYAAVPIPQAMSHMISVTQPWQTRDGQWLLPHLNLPHLSERVLEVLQCESTPAAVGAAVGRWDADALEDAIAAARACGGKIRTEAQWLAHPQGRYLAGQPIVQITKVADSAPEPFAPGRRPLSGVRVLDLTRILAGPVAGRTLAEHGADVLMVTAPHLPQTPEHVRDTSHGKRSCFLDLRQSSQADTMRTLLREADVFIDGYRPGRLGSLGFTSDELLRLRPGLVQLSVSCFGPGGPWADRAGWEQVAQAVTGVCHRNGQLTSNGRPKLVFAPLCDYTTGYLGALGVMLALARRAREGGSYRVDVSLCQSAMFAQRQGLVDTYQDAPQQLDANELDAYTVASDTCYGALKTLGPVLRMSETAPRWAIPTPRLGGDAPAWQPR